MEFRFTEEQAAIATQARRFLSHAVDATLWDGIVHQMGWLGVAVPEALGGAGLSAVELAILMQETGAVLAPVPFFATAGLAIPAILAAGTPAQQAALLAPILAGEAATLCFTGTAGEAGVAGVTAELRREAGAFRLSGAAGFVPHAMAASYLVVACRAPGSRGASGISLVAVRADAAGVRRVEHTCLDLTRPYSTVTFDGVVAAQGAVLGEPEEAAAALAQVLAFSAAMLAAEQLGGAEAVLRLSVEHAQQRVQFGRPIGGFQAVKHKLADMMVLVEAARSAAYYAACVAAEAPAELPEAASIARAYCSDAYNRCAADAIQILGGMGFTWDHPAHRYFKRARASGTLLGDSSWHRELVARHMGLDEAAA